MMTQAPEPECVLTNRRPPAHDLGCTGIGDKEKRRPDGSSVLQV